MNASEQLVEVVRNIFWVVATAFTTDAPREYFLQKHDQAYFNQASTVHRRLLALESADKMIGSFDIDLALSEGFYMWLCGDTFAFQRWLHHSQVLRKPVATFVVSDEWMLLLSLISPTGLTDDVRKQRDLLKNTGSRHQPALDAASRADIQPGFVKRCRELISNSVEAALERAHDMIKPYTSDYQNAVLRIVGKPVRHVERPTWGDLANSTRLTTIKLVHKACKVQATEQGQQEPGEQEPGEQEPESDCFEAARKLYGVEGVIASEF